MENCEDYEVFFLAPGLVIWYPHSEHFHQEEAAMRGADGDIITVKEQNEVILSADLSGLYAEPLSWSCYEVIVDAQLNLPCLDYGTPFRGAKLAN